MDFMELAKERYSVRRFTNQKIENEKLETVLQAGRLAPTACNNQPQRIYVLQSKEALQKLEGCTKYTFDAPLAFLICYDESESWKRSYDGADGGETDSSIVTSHMMLALAELGLGSCWVGSFDPQAVRQAFELPDTVIPHALLPAGYPAKDATPSPGHASRKPLEETVRYI
ncbi:nitroreductase family protein [Christensenellaceae bacterium OttesenSCG-928-K19]|nr:nitroreductase family protein [Christensenellaceae bacterium OttesenSCG-928-K19]